MAWKLENMRKDPNSKELYADLFISQIKEEPKTACLFAIGDARTVEIILEKYKNTQFVVFDYPALIKFLDFAKPANLFKAIPIKYDWESEAEFLKFIEVEMRKVSIEEVNMPFDLIIANPPYGKSSSLSKKIVKTLLENKVAEEYIILAPLKSNIPTWSKIREIKGPFGLSEVFDIPEASDQDVYITSYPGKEPFTQTYEKVQMNKKQLEWFEAIERYNKDHENPITFLQMLTSNKKDVYSKYEENQIFEIPIYTPANGVQLNGQTGEHNLQEKPIKWQESSSAPWGLYFDTRKAFENFRDWYYKVPYSFSRSKRNNINCLCDLMLSILLSIWGSGPSILKYDFILPHLDWSHPWTDEEILKELRLPEDFLGEEPLL